jgi:hypothetical protein
MSIEITEEMVQLASDEYFTSRGRVPKTLTEAHDAMRAALTAVAPLMQAKVVESNEARNQYYYKVDGCKAPNSSDADCICWHDEGTGPLQGPDSKWLAEMIGAKAAAPRTWRYKPAEPVKLPDGWRETFAELLEDYAEARAETAVWNTTQCVQPKAGIRMPRPRLAKLMAHVDLLAAPDVQS